MFTKPPFSKNDLNYEPSTRRVSKNRNPEQFCRLAESGRIIRAYSGFLPGLESTARHVLRCEHLELIPGEGFSPYRAESHFTHQIWIWYRFNHSPERLNLLFRGQFNFLSSDFDAHALARRVTDYLSELLVHSDVGHEQLFLNESSWKFWALAVDSFISTEEKLNCLVDAAKAQKPHTDEAYLKIRALKLQTHSFSSVLINQLFSNILMARKISRREQQILFEMLSESDVIDEHKAMIKRLFDEIKRGSVKVR